MEQILIQAGLSELQAAAYWYLLQHGEANPPEVAKSLKMTRTNAYKVLDSLQDLGLASRETGQKKIVYKAADPSALANLVAEQRNNVIALEHNVREAMQQLRNTYQASSGATRVESKQGESAMVKAYEDQAETKQPIYFIKSRADVLFLGYETMDRLRRLPVQYNTERYGITPDETEGPSNPEIDKRTKLYRTWVNSDNYTAPVEWTASGDELLIQIFDGEGRVVRIADAQVAGAFRQLWQLTDSALRNDPGYKKLPRHAARKI